MSAKDAGEGGDVSYLERLVLERIRSRILNVVLAADNPKPDLLGASDLETGFQVVIDRPITDFSPKVIESLANGFDTAFVPNLHKRLTTISADGSKTVISLPGTLAEIAEKLTQVETILNTAIGGHPQVRAAAIKKENGAGSYTTPGK